MSPRTLHLAADLIDPEPVPAIFGDRPPAPVQRMGESAETFRNRQREWLVELADWKEMDAERRHAATFLGRYGRLLASGR